MGGVGLDVRRKGGVVLDTCFCCAGGKDMLACYCGSLLEDVVSPHRNHFAILLFCWYDVKLSGPGRI